MPTHLDTDHGTVTIDTYCPACGGDAVPLIGRPCDCDLADDVLCSVVVDHPAFDEPIRTELTDQAGLTRSVSGGEFFDALARVALRTV